jgi:hypothetical protein
MHAVVVFYKKAATEQFFTDMIAVIGLRSMSYIGLSAFINGTYKAWLHAQHAFFALAT